VEELFSAVKTEFKHLEFYYFHNCVYDFMWKNNRRRFAEKFPTWDIIRKYNKDYKLIFVGDATMSPYEILQPGGSVEYNNEEPGAEWMQRLTHAFPKFAWINPEPQGVWQYRQSISIIQQLIGATACSRCHSRGWKTPCGCCGDVGVVGVTEGFEQRPRRLIQRRRCRIVAPAQQHPARPSPALGHAHVVIPQHGDRFPQGRIGAVGQRRKHVQFLVLMVQRRGNIEVAQHIGRGRSGRTVMPARIEVFDEPPEQVQRALDAFVAGPQHLEGLLESDGGCFKTGQWRVNEPIEPLPKKRSLCAGW
jgi:hypothetical protein